MKSTDRELQENYSDCVYGRWIETPPIPCSGFGACLDTSTVPFVKGGYSSAPLCLPCVPEWYCKEGEILQVLGLLNAYSLSDLRSNFEIWGFVEQYLTFKKFIPFIRIQWYLGWLSGGFISCQMLRAKRWYSLLKILEYLTM